MSMPHKEPLAQDFKGSKFHSAKERRTYETIPDDIEAQVLDQYFHLTPSDLALINARDVDSLRLGMALRLCVLRWLGHYLGRSDKLPTAAVKHVRRQLNLSDTVDAVYPTVGRAGIGVDPLRI